MLGVHAQPAGRGRGAVGVVVRVARQPGAHDAGAGPAQRRPGRHADALALLPLLDAQQDRLHALLPGTLTLFPFL